jgi:hypothetical protein
LLKLELSLLEDLNLASAKIRGGAQTPLLEIANLAKNQFANRRRHSAKKGLALIAVCPVLGAAKWE